MAGWLADVLRGEAPETDEKPRVINWSSREEPGQSTDLRRILALPRKPELGPERLAALVAEFTTRLRLQGGTMVLRAIQALALYEAELAGGLLGAIGVGEGKTLICFLLPTVLRAKRTVLLIPPQLRDQVINRAHPALAQHWQIPALGEELHVVAYSELSTARTADVLERLQPDLIVLDEAHAVRNLDASRTKRFRRYFKAHPHTKLCALSGTILSKSIRDLGDLAKFSLGSGSPIPLAFPTLQAWAEALDPADFTPPPGELIRLCELGEDVRSGFRRRFLSTPGVVATLENKVGASLVFYRRDLPLAPKAKAALEHLRNTWTTPNGEEEFSDALTFSRYARQLAAGLYFRWVWPEGESLELRTEWMERRRNWNKAVRERLKSSIPGQDSPLLCQRAAESGAWACEAYEPWKEIKDAAHPASEAVWVSRFLVEDAVRWGTENVGIIWAEHPVLGEAIAQAGGFPHYGEASRRILDEAGSRTVVAQGPIFGTGTDGLHTRWHKQLLTHVFSSATNWEQRLGRLHREGTTADEVETHVYLHTPEMRDAFETARKTAQWLWDVKGEKQRLAYASLAF